MRAETRLAPLLLSSYPTEIDNHRTTASIIIIYYILLRPAFCWKGWGSLGFFFDVDAGLLYKRPLLDH